MPTLNEQLLEAVIKGREALIISLIKAGSDVNVVDDFGRTYLQFAARNGQLVSVLALIDAGSDVNAKDKRGDTALFYSSDRLANKETCLALINSGADLHALNNSRRTALHRAAGCGKVEESLFLIAAGAMVNAKDNIGSTPLHIAAELEKKEVVYVLANAFADVNAQDAEGRTPLQRAVFLSNRHEALILLAYGANVGSKCNFDHMSDLANMTMREAAVQEGLTERLLVLIEHHPSKYPQDRLEDLAAMAKLHKKNDVEAFLRSHIAAQAIEKIMPSSYSARMS